MGFCMVVVAPYEFDKQRNKTADIFREGKWLLQSAGICALR